MYSYHYIVEAAARALPSVVLQAAPGGGNKNFESSLHCVFIFVEPQCSGASPAGFVAARSYEGSSPKRGVSKNTLPCAAILAGIGGVRIERLYRVRTRRNKRRAYRIQRVSIIDCCSCARTTGLWVLPRGTGVFLYSGSRSGTQLYSLLLETNFLFPTDKMAYRPPPSPL